MTDPEKRRLAARTCLATFSACCWSLAAVSLFARLDGVWSGLQHTQHAFSRYGVAHQGDCWLCGMSRAFRALWGGHVGEAVGYNACSPILFAVMLAGCASVFFMLRRPRRPDPPG